MTLHDLDPKQKLIIIFSSIILVSIFILLLFFQPTNKYGNGVNINNYDKYISNLPTDRKQALNAALYNIIKSNSGSDSVPEIKDANIRDNSIEYNYDYTTNVHSGSFIVDIDSINQSYLMFYRWSSTPNSSYLSGYTATASCIETNKLIYGEFDCKDDFSNSSSLDERDPIIDYLPYSTYNYYISANTDKKGSVTLEATIYLYSSDTRNNNRDTSITKYKSEIINWIKSKKLNPDNYTINYTIE